MIKNYKVLKDFRFGEINKEVKRGETIGYDHDSNEATIGNIQYPMKNFRVALKVEWVVPIDGEYVDFDKKDVGLTPDMESELKRKERFEEMRKKQNSENTLQKDKRMLAGSNGCHEEGSRPFVDALCLDTPPITNKKKMDLEIVQDDSKEIGRIDMLPEESTNNTKIAVGKIETFNKKAYDIYNDQYDAESIEISKIGVASRELTIKNWSSMHWTKKVDVIDKSDKELLNELKGIERSAKILKRIEDRIKG